MNARAFAVVAVALIGTGGRRSAESGAYGASASFAASASGSLPEADGLAKYVAPEDDGYVERSAPPPPQLLLQPASSPSAAASRHSAAAGECVCRPAVAVAAGGDGETKLDVSAAMATLTDAEDDATANETEDQSSRLLQKLRDWLHRGGPAAVVAAAATEKARSAQSSVASTPPTNESASSSDGRNDSFPSAAAAASAASAAEPLLRAPTNATSSLGCPHGFFTLRDWDHCYLLSTFKTTRALAREYCYSMGGDVELLAINSTREQYLVTYLIQQTGAFKDADDWWTSGTGMGYSASAWALRVKYAEMRFTMWSHSSPTHSDKGRCVILQKSSNYFWSSDKCLDDTKASTGLPRHNFICKAPAAKPRPCI